MTKYLLDSYAWVEYFLASSSGKKVKEIIEDGKHEIFTSVITIAEVCGKAKKEGMDYNLAFRKITSLSSVAQITPEIAMNAGVARQEIRKKVENFGMADAIILITARGMGAKVLTGDYHFKGFKEAEML